MSKKTRQNKAQQLEQSARFGRWNLWSIARVLTGCVFVVSGYLKLLEPHQNFLADVENYEIVSGFLSEWVARIFPWLELTLGVFFVAGLWTRQVLMVLWLMITIFIGVVGSALARDLPITDCGCFGDWFSIPLKGLLVMDSGLWVLFAFMFFRETALSAMSLDRRYEPRAELAVKQ